MKKGLFIAAMMMAGTMQSFAQFNNIWVKAVTVPTDGGTVFVDWAVPQEDEDYKYAATSEYKTSKNLAASEGYIWANAASGWQLAGFAHDNNKNGQFDNDVTVDKQIWRRSNGLFTAIYDPTEYVGQSSTEAYGKAQEALEQMTTPTDLVFAIFTKGTIAIHQIDQEHLGKVWISKLDNAAGDQLKLEAYGDSWYNPIKSKNQYYKFEKWTKKGDSSFSSTDRVLNVTAEEGATYYANFVETTKTDFDDNERNLDPHKEDYQTSGDIPILGIQSVKTNATSTPVFDLQGRRVAKATKGIFIQNGKKVVVK